MKRMEIESKNGSNVGHNSPVFRLATDFVFALLAVYLLLNYVRTVIVYANTPLLIMRDSFLALYLLMAILLLIVRNRALAFTARKRDYVFTVLGFTSPLLFQPAIQGRQFLIGWTLELFGLAFVVSAFISLNRSFGLAPENRGVRTKGAYRLVRHPMYLGYILAEAGYVLDNASEYNLLILIVSTLFLLLRLRAEEILLHQDPKYRNYEKRVKWRLLPFIF